MRERSEEAIEIAGLPAFARRPPLDPDLAVASAELATARSLSEPRFHAVSRPASALTGDLVLEALSPDGEEYGTERLWTALERDGALKPRTLVGRILDDVAQFRGGAPPHDDTTIVAVKP